jgi:thymidylate synthase (FAD)
MNEESGRYSVIREEFHEPSPGDVGYQSKNNKQGRSDETIDPALVQYFSDFLKHNRQIAYAGYEAFLESNVARELARLVLPVSTYSQFYWQMNLRNLFHFLKLRLNRHAQKETRDFALQIAKCAQAVAPLAYEAFEEYHLRGAEFSREEVKYIQLLVRGEELPANAFEGKSNHRREFEEKLNFDLPAIV